jgi:hypothetical protein
MTANSFFPSNEADQIVWLNNYAAKLPVNGEVCDIGGDEITRTLADIAYHVWLLKDYRPATRRDSAETNAFIALTPTKCANIECAGGTKANPTANGAHPRKWWWGRCRLFPSSVIPCTR